MHQDLHVWLTYSNSNQVTWCPLINKINKTYSTEKIFFAVSGLYNLEIKLNHTKKLHSSSAHTVEFALVAVDNDWKD